MQWLAVLINRANENKQPGAYDSYYQQPATAERRIFLIKSAECVTGSHHADPWDQRIEHKDKRTGKRWPKGKQSGLMQEHPELRAPARYWSLRSLPGSHRISIEDVVQSDHGDTKARDYFQRQVDQARQNNHRHSDYKDHLQKQDEARIQIEERSRTHHRGLKYDQPDSATN